MIEPDELCLCQSGEKYQNCCYLKKNIAEDYTSKRIFSSFVLETRQKASEEYCIHPNTIECTPEIIRAHNIQHNGILNHLAVNGHVYMPVSDIFKQKLQLKYVGITRQATVFTGFCGYHDNKVFSEIEDSPFANTPQQLFLYAYKAFSFTYYKIRRENKLNDVLFNEYNFSNYIMFLYHRMLQKYFFKFVIHELDTFNECILSKDYSNMKSLVGELNYEVSFAVSSAFVINYDLLEKELSPSSHDEKLPLIYLTIFPNNGVTKYIFSYFIEYENIYSGLIQQINSIPLPLLLKYLNNLIILNVENLVISPRLINHWSEIQKNDFENVVQKSIENSINHLDKNNYFATRSFNIFENI